MAVRPINVPVGQGFGVNPAVYAKLGMKGHNGWDFPAPLGTSVVAPESGTVSTGYDASGYGNNVTLQGDSGWQHKLAHFQRFGKTGRVSEGDIVGYVNSTGFSTGNHLHWGTRPPRYDQGNGYYGFVDPQIFLSGQKGVSSLPYSDKAYSDAKAGAINFLFITYHDEGASEAQVKQYLNTDLVELENSLKDPDNPASEQHRNCVKKIWKEYTGREIKDPEIRERTKQTNNQLREDLVKSEEHINYVKGKK